MVFNIADFTIDGEECCAEELRAKQYIEKQAAKQAKIDAPKPKFKTASPTINTRAAMKDVFDMFNAPLSCDIVEKEVVEDETISAKVFKPLATFGKLGVFRDEVVDDKPGKLEVFCNEPEKMNVFRDEAVDNPGKIPVFCDEPEKMNVFRDEAAPKPGKMPVFCDEPEKMNVFRDEAAPKPGKMPVFRDEPEKMNVFRDEAVVNLGKMSVFCDEPEKMNVFRDEAAPKPGKMPVFRDEPEKMDLFRGTPKPGKRDTTKPPPAFEMSKDSTEEVEESPSKVDASLQSPREFIRAARNRKSNFRFDIFPDEEEEDSEDAEDILISQPEGDSLDERSQTKEALRELLELDPSGETPRKQVVVEKSPHREDIHSSYIHSSFMSNEETDSSLLDFKRALASQDQEYNVMATAKGDRIFSSQVFILNHV
jgi:hypothetical protein